MKIGIIGSGNMGRAVGVRFAAAGHEVVFGARRLSQAQAAAALAGQGAKAGSTDDAARDADVLVWTIRDGDPAVVFADPALLDGKTIIDLNNRDYADEVRSGVWFQEAIAERLQALMPKARVVKALNTIAMESFDISAGALRAAGAQSFIAGSSEDAKRIVSRLLDDIGFEAVDIGDTPAAMRAAEALGDIIRLLMIDGQRGGRAALKLTTLPQTDMSIVGAREASNYK